MTTTTQKLQVATDALNEIQWRNIRNVVCELAEFCFGSADHPQYGTAYVALVNALTAKDGISVRLEPLAAPSTEQQAATADGLPYGYVLKTGHGNAFRETLDGVAREARHMWVAVDKRGTSTVAQAAPAGDAVEILQVYRPGNGWHDVGVNEYIGTTSNNRRRLYAEPPAATERAATQPAGEVLTQARYALEVAMQICDAIPTRLQNSPDSTLARIGELVNARPDGQHGYAIIHDALSSVRNATPEFLYQSAPTTKPEVSASATPSGSTEQPAAEDGQITAHQAVHMLRLALVSAECAIKGREHTGFIAKALTATAHITAPSSRNEQPATVSQTLSDNYGHVVTTDANFQRPAGASVDGTEFQALVKYWRGEPYGTRSFQNAWDALITHVDSWGAQQREAGRLLGWDQNEEAHKPRIETMVNVIKNRNERATATEEESDHLWIELADTLTELASTQRKLIAVNAEIAAVNLNRIATEKERDDLRAELDEWVHTNKIDVLQRERDDLRARVEAIDAVLVEVTLERDTARMQLADANSRLTEQAEAVQRMSKAWANSSSPQLARPADLAVLTRWAVTGTKDGNGKILSMQFTEAGYGQFVAFADVQALLSK